VASGARDHGPQWSSAGRKAKAAAICLTRNDMAVM
jgi:hypothetical protein